MAFAVELVNVRKSFGEVSAVDGVDLAVGEGEFFSMLGPSGSGKTTCLRLIAGFEQVTSGTILLGGNDVSAIPPNKRDCNTVFQDYALFPHMTVLENVAYGLKVKGVGAADRHSQASTMLDMVQLGDFASRRPNQLSGGQRQRVALARALVNKPQTLLLDEPLGALDQKLREEMQVELKSIQREVGITFIFVTHDQGEALSMSDRVAVFNNGRVEQIGTPTEIYERPSTPFVADFVGTTNILSAATKAAFGIDAAIALIRPERVRFVATNNDVNGPGVASVSGTVLDHSYRGSFTQTTVLLGDGSEITIQSTDSNSDDITSRGSHVNLTWDTDAVTSLPAGHE